MTAAAADVADADVAAAAAEVEVVRAALEEEVEATAAADVVDATAAEEAEEEEDLLLTAALEVVLTEVEVDLVEVEDTEPLLVEVEVLAEDDDACRLTAGAARTPAARTWDATKISVKRILMDLKAYLSGR